MSVWSLELSYHCQSDHGLVNTDPDDDTNNEDDTDGSDDGGTEPGSPVSRTVSSSIRLQFVLPV